MVLNKVATLGGVFARKTDHPLADAKEMRRLLAEIPKDNAFKALDEVIGWLESVAGVDDFRADRLLDVLTQLSEIAQPHLRRLSREYFQSVRLSRPEESRLWSINIGYWIQMAAAYERCLAAVSDKPRAGELSRAMLPLVVVRLIQALANVLKWEYFHYLPAGGELWARLGRALLAAESAGLADKAVGASGIGGMTSPTQAYQQAMAFQSAALDSLLPAEIDVADRLIGHCLAGFVFSQKAQVDSVYWVDLALAQPPQRMALLPPQSSDSLRFIKPAAAHASLSDLLATLERGGAVPADINLGAEYSPKLLIGVLRHLVAYLAPIPPQRQHDRHRVKHRMSVLNGLVNAFVAFSAEFGGRPVGLPIESWVVENVSRGGFGAVLNSVPSEWLRVGALIAMQPEGGENWLVGVVRRYNRAADKQARVGIQAIARRALAVELRVRGASSYAAAGGMPALLLQDGNEAGEVRAVLAPGTFSARDDMEYVEAGQRFVLKPVMLVEQNQEFELARFRLSALG